VVAALHTQVEVGEVDQLPVVKDWFFERRLRTAHTTGIQGFVEWLLARLLLAHSGITLRPLPWV
jgi:hypothetical protein